MIGDPLAGRVIDAKYRIEAEIGRGGMATIYRATRLQIGDAVAVKVMHAELLRDPKLAERFKREAQAAARLKHPNVVTIHDFGVAEDGLIYLVMELVEGRNLRTIIREDGPMPAALADAIVRQVCAALGEAHRQGVIHRDIKPANIAVEESADGLRVKVLDFGIASLRAGTMMSFTQTGALLGTPAYMSPEQCLGEELDNRSDIYSLGVVMFEMLSGVVPFNSPTATAVVMQHVQQAPPPLRVLNASVSAAVEAMVLRALSKRREQRFQSAKELADACDAAVTGARRYGEDATIVAPRFEQGMLAQTMVQSPMQLPLGVAPQTAGKAPKQLLSLIAGIALSTALLIGAGWLVWPRIVEKPTAVTPTRPAVSAKRVTTAAPTRVVSPDSPLTPDNVLPLLRATAALRVSTQPGNETAYVTVPDTPAHGEVDRYAILSGRMADGRWVGVVPLNSHGPAGIAYSLMWVWTDGRAQFVGEIPAENNGYGHLTTLVRNGTIYVGWPVYGPSDGSCCPSLLRSKILTLDGIRLRPLSDQIVANR
jgi:tRNA A-37 threonylcarbamoyl transferase component Bud32